MTEPHTDPVALSLYEVRNLVKDLQERMLGPGHPDTQTTRRNLSHWTKSAEGGAEARRSS